MSNHLLNNHCRFVTDDLDLSREVMSKLWEHHKIRLNSGSTYGALARRRLRAAWDLLRNPGATVTQVVADCGFFHLGRFASRYHEVFGETPSTSLSRARRR
jgi:transcriptional regulator GlxA family with amidase domain